MNYKKNLIDLINDINNEKLLRYLYYFIKNFIELRK